jgi:hypothetical protein
MLKLYITSTLNWKSNYKLNELDIRIHEWYSYLFNRNGILKQYHYLNNKNVNPWPICFPWTMEGKSLNNTLPEHWKWESLNTTLPEQCKWESIDNTLPEQWKWESWNNTLPEQWNWECLNSARHHNCHVDSNLYFHTCDVPILTFWGHTCLWFCKVITTCKWSSGAWMTMSH